MAEGIKLIQTTALLQPPPEYTPFLTTSMKSAKALLLPLSAPEPSIRTATPGVVEVCQR